MNALTGLDQIRLSISPEIAGGKKLSQVEVEYDLATRSVWTYLKPSGTACFNPGLLSDLHNNHEFFKKNQGQALHADRLFPVDYFVVASGIEHVFNYGGDLALFVLLIKSRDRDALLHY